MKIPCSGCLAALVLAVVALSGSPDLYAAPVVEYGSMTRNQSSSSQWRTVYFDKAFATPPVVILGPPSSNDSEPCTVRVRNITTTRFQWQIDEYEYLDGAHGSETVSYLAMEEGIHTLNGQTFEAGRASVGQGFANVLFSAAHSEIPMVLSQVETINNMADATNTVSLTTRTRNVTTAGFEIRLQDQQSNTFVLASESVGYIALKPGSGYLDKRPYIAMTTGNLVDHIVRTFDFPYLLPGAGILASDQTLNGGDMASLRYENATESSVDLRMEEETSGDTETAHADENVGVLAVGDPYSETDAKLDIFSIRVNHAWKTIDLSQSYVDPIIVVGPPTYAGGDKSTVRVRNVTSDSFEVQIDEWDYRDGPHSTETLGVIVMEAGIYEIGGLKWIADKRNGVTESPRAVTFPTSFADPPVVLGRIVTTNETSAVVHQINSLNGSSFRVRVAEELGAADRTHAPETFHYVAIEAGSGSFESAAGINFSVGTADNPVGDSPETIAFDRNYALPVFLGDFQTRNESDPASLRVKNLTAGSALVFAEEEESTSSGTTHVGETVGYIVSSTVEDTDGDGIGDDWENANGLDPNDPGDGDDDPDNDLLTNLEEFEAGYDPHSFSGGRISITVREEKAYEKSGARARIQVNRFVGKAAVTVHFTVDGGANGYEAAGANDYDVTLANGTLLSGSITIPQGESRGYIYIDPVLDTVPEYPEIVRVTLDANASYIATGPAREVSISDATDHPDNDKLYVGLYVPEAWASGQTSASGFATLVMNGTNTRAKISSYFSGLTSPQNAAHVHRTDTSDPDLAGPTVFSLPDEGEFTEVIWDIQRDGSPSPRYLINTLNRRNGQFLYANIHTSQFPAGEIRAPFRLVGNPSEEWSPPAAPPAHGSLTGIELKRDVARFLTQATFGPKIYEINNLYNDILDNHGGDRIKGYTAWIDAQLGYDQTNLYDYTLAADTEEWDLREDLTATDPVRYPESTPLYPNNQNDPDYHNRRRAWWTISAQARDQLRQRAGFALSEIFVVSENDGLIRQRHYGLANYYDMLLSHVDGNYTDLLRDVSTHPIMGHYLSHLKNEHVVDEYGNTIILPDENYAREVMQLFSIGLLSLNPDGTLALGSNGLPSQTYTNVDITELAKIFTGWSFSKAHGSRNDGYPIIDNTNFNRSSGPKYYQASWMNPMKCFENKHDRQAKSVLGVSFPADTNGSDEMDQLMTALTDHPNTAPFISRLLIQRLTTSNPSRGYIYRVASAFDTGTYTDSAGNSRGSGVRGDLEATIRAILLDHEARDLTIARTNKGFGKQKEPIIRYMQILRGLEGRSNLPINSLSGYGYPGGQLNNFPGSFPTTESRLRYSVTDTQLSQTPLKSPTVFNWFLPDYDPGGDISAAGLVAPEMSRTTESQVISILNYSHTITRGSSQGVTPLIGQADSLDDNITLRRRELLQTYYESRIAAGDSVRLAVTRVINQLDLILMAGNFRAAYESAPTPNPRSIIIDLIEQQSEEWRVRDAFYMMITTPEFIHQK